MAETAALALRGRLIMEGYPHDEVVEAVEAEGKARLSAAAVKRIRKQLSGPHGNKEDLRVCRVCGEIVGIWRGTYKFVPGPAFGSCRKQYRCKKHPEKG